MVKNDNLSKLTHQLCELRLEERRVRSDIRHLVARNATIDFAKAKQLNIMRNGVNRVDRSQDHAQHHRLILLCRFKKRLQLPFRYGKKHSIFER